MPRFMNTPPTERNRKHVPVVYVSFLEMMR